MREVRAVDHLSTSQAREWLSLADIQLRHVAALRDGDEDLLQTAERIGAVDADTVAAAAYPTDDKRRRAVSTVLADAARAGRRANLVPDPRNG